MINRITNEQQKIFKLNVDCFDEILEYLSLIDLHSLGQTCKVMHMVTSEFFKRNYLNDVMGMCGYKPRKFKHIEGGFIYSREPAFIHMVSKICFNNYIFYRPNFDSYYTKEYHCNGFGFYTNEFKAVRYLKLFVHQVYETVIEMFGAIFPQLEWVDLQQIHITDYLYDKMLKQCVNLKSLHLKHYVYHSYSRHQYKDDNSSHQYNDYSLGPGIKQKYPKLEYLEMSPIPSIYELNAFFENNPNIRSFSTDAKSFWKNRNEILYIKIQLDLLVITYFEDIQRKDCVVPFCDLLNQLYAKGFYKRIHIIYISEIYDERVYLALVSLNGLEKIHIDSIHRNIIGVSNKYLYFFTFIFL